VIPDENSRYHELVTDRPGERLWVHRSEALPGLDFMKVAGSDRRWDVVHDSFAVCLVQGPGSMQAEWLYRRQLHRIGVGEMQLMEPGEVHRTTRVSEPASFFVVRFGPEALSEEARELGAARSLHFGGSQVAFEELRRSLTELDASLCSPSSELELQCRAAESTYRLIANCAESKPRSRKVGPLHAGLRRARRRLDERFAEKIELGELAKEAGMGKFYFAHEFTGAYGVSPCHYLVMRRVEAARALLQEGVSIAEASAMTGFADQAHLTRKFRKILGYTPGAWARVTRRRVEHSVASSCLSPPSVAAASGSHHGVESPTAR